MRRAEREATLDVLEDVGLIIKTIGGKPSARAARGREAGVRAASLSPALGVIHGGPQGASESSSPPVVAVIEPAAVEIAAVEIAAVEIAGSALAVEPVRVNNRGPASRRSRTRSGRP